VTVTNRLCGISVIFTGQITIVDPPSVAGIAEDGHGKAAMAAAKV
jgi:hypothetical protein